MSALLSLASTLSEMLRPGLVSSSVVLSIIAIFTISQIDVSSARSLSLSDGYWSSTGDISKRNSWWSKKSLESAPDYQRLLQESAFENPSLDANGEDEPLPAYSSLFKCYVRECVPQFVQCAQRSGTQEDFLDCKRRHEVCGLLCGTVTTAEPVI